MCTLRLSLVATLMLTLVAGTGATLALDEDIHVAGEVNCSMVEVPRFTPTEASDMGTYVELRGDQTWSNDWADPRLPETFRLQWHGHEYDLPGTSRLLRVHTGTMNGETEDGGWTGTFQHTMGTDFLRNFDATLDGTGAYEGLAAIISGNWTGVSGWEVSGAIVADMPKVDEVAAD